MREYRLLGPPGTGKTSWVVKQIERASQKYAPEQIYLCSFTKAAAVEIANRVQPTGLYVARENIGTIHALCYRALGSPPIAETMMKEWSAKYPEWGMEKKNGDRLLDEAAMDEDDGPDLLQEYNLWRGKDRHGPMPLNVQRFAQAWEDFKLETGALDFTDLLLQAPERLQGCKVLIVDEAQDLNPLQWRIVRRWGEQAEVFCVAGDEDQTLYRFMGADPAGLMAPIAPENVLHLHQSYRVSRAVHAVAQRWIERLGTRRNPKPYQPTGEEGEVAWSPLGLAEPEALAQALLGESEQGRTVMCLASCSYMLRPVTEALRKLGAPFHNPYRRRRGDWNPLGKQETIRRVASFGQARRALKEDDRAAVRRTETWAWVQLVKSKGNMVHGLKKDLLDLGDRITDEMAVIDMVMQGLSGPAADAFMSGDWNWLIANLTEEARRQGEYAARILQRGGDAARCEPKIIIGTIHSVKGGEADTVFLVPELSRASVQDCQDNGQDAEDAIVRMAYVGMTRARRKLVLCEPSTKLYFEVT